MTGTPEFNTAIENFRLGCIALEEKRNSVIKIQDPTVAVFENDVETAKTALLIEVAKP